MYHFAGHLAVARGDETGVVSLVFTDLGSVGREYGEALLIVDFHLDDLRAANQGGDFLAQAFDIGQILQFGLGLSGGTFDQQFDVRAQQMTQRLRHADIAAFRQVRHFAYLMLTHQFPEQSAREDEQDEGKQRKIAGKS